MSFSDWVSSISDEVPLVEGNLEQRPRKVVFKNCSIVFDRKKSNRKTWLSKSSRVFSHWALEIGEYSYDLRVKDRIPCRYIVSQIPGVYESRAFEFNIKPVFHTHGKWKIDNGSKERKQYEIGTTSLSDAAINDVALAIVEGINAQGGFHRFDNNCQTFSKGIARIIDPISRSLEEFTDASKFMKRVHNAAKLAAYCAQDTLTELQIKSTPKKLEQFFDDESYEDTELARVFLAAVEKIGAKAELIDQSDKRWNICRVEQPRFLAPQFENKGIYNFSDAQTLAAYKASMVYGTGGLVNQGVNVSGWVDSKSALRAANSQLDVSPYMADHKNYLRPASPMIRTDGIGRAGSGPTVQSMPRLDRLSLQNKDFMI